MAWRFFTNAGKEKVRSKSETRAGVITAFAGATAPTGWLLCDGSQISRSTYGALDGVLGETYGTYTDGSGGVGRSHLRLPDLRGRATVGAGTLVGDGGSGVSGAVTGAASAEVLPGATAGTETVTITASVPTHTHTVTGGGAHTHTITNTSHTHTLLRNTQATSTGDNTGYAFDDAVGSGSTATSSAVTISATIDPAVSGITVAGSGVAPTAHSNLDAFVVTQFVIKT
jgi:microcystin-dependent protein